MELRAWKRALGTGLAIAILSGCAAQNVTGAVPQGTISAGHGALGKSWIKPGSSGETLIYISSQDYYPPSHTSSVYIYNYPSGELVGTITGLEYVEGLCSDSDGDVWVTTYDNSTTGFVYEYSHGATSPKATLTDDGEALDCSLDPSSGNLAVGNCCFKVAMYANASGSPTYYTTPKLEVDEYLSYDGSGNLYVDSNRSYKADWIPKGGAVTRFGFTPKARHGGLIWDGQYLTADYGATIYRYQPSGGRSGNPVGTVTLDGLDNVDGEIGCCYYSIEDSILALAHGDAVNVYDYPEGGEPTLTISGLTNAIGVAISIAPSAPRRK